MKQSAPYRSSTSTNTTLWTLAIVAGVALAVTAGWQLANPAELSRQLAEAKNDLRTTREEVLRLKKELAEKPALLSQRDFSSPQESTAAASSHAGANDSKPAAPGPPAEPVGKSLRKMLEAPGMRAVMKQQQAAQITQAYGRLFDTLSLDDQEKAAFNQLLADRLSAQTDLGLKMMDGSMTPEQRQEAIAAYKATKQSSDAAIKSFLNDDNDYQTFQQWEDTAPERMQMQMVGESLFASSGEPLSAQQEQQLVDSMHQARKQSGNGQDPGNPDNFNPSQFTEEGLQKTLQTADANAQTVTQNAKSFLTSGQLQTLANMQSQLRGMTETSMRMAMTMFGGKTK